jgi:hypothetical protein
MVREVFGGTIVDIGIWNFVIGIYFIRAFVAKAVVGSQFSVVSLQ